MTKDELRKQAEDDLSTYAVLVNPSRVYGDIHHQVFRWLQNNNLQQLLLLPRSHMKSHCIAVWASWWITKHPYTTIIYLSATEPLALQQLYAIKMILESDVYRRYWPDMVHPEEAKREKWAASEIKVDHPARKAQGVRDATVLAKSIGSNATGLHCDVLVLDDIVVPQNAYTEVGRTDVQATYSQFSSIANPGAIIKAVGTRYHPKDIYGIFMSQEAETFAEDGSMTGSEPMWEVFSRAVVDEAGNYLWPREQHPKTKQWFGFNPATLARIRSSYYSMGERAQYHAQYFNDPNDKSSNRVDSNGFLYYNRDKLTNEGDQWFYQGKLLATFCGGDFAYTTGTRSDYTAFAVVGVMSDGFKLLLDLDQFKTDKYEAYYQAVFKLHRKWGFRRAKVEVNAGANIIANYIKDRIREEGLLLTLGVQNSVANKAERTAAILEPVYEKLELQHFKGGFISEYEEQLTLARPAHDDLKDAVTLAIEIAKAPSKFQPNQQTTNRNVVHARFGGSRR